MDTHKDFHVAAVLNVSGGLLGTRSLLATLTGYQQLIGWVNQFGVLQRAGVEGTGAYGAGLTRALHAAGVAVVEVNRPDRATRRRRGKTDAIDAEAAAGLCDRRGGNGYGYSRNRLGIRPARSHPAQNQRWEALTLRRCGAGPIRTRPTVRQPLIGAPRRKEQTYR